MSSHLRFEKQIGGHVNFRKNGLKPKNQKYNHRKVKINVLRSFACYDSKNISLNFCRKILRIEQLAALYRRRFRKMMYCGRQHYSWLLHLKSKNHNDIVNISFFFNIEKRVFNFWQSIKEKLRVLVKIVSFLLCKISCDQRIEKFFFKSLFYCIFKLCIKFEKNRLNSFRDILPIDIKNADFQLTLNRRFQGHQIIHLYCCSQNISIWKYIQCLQYYVNIMWNNVNRMSRMAGDSNVSKSMSFARIDLKF